MITLHRLGHSDEPFLLNDDLIVTVEATVAEGPKEKPAMPPMPAAPPP